MMYNENDQKLLKTYKNFYQGVTSRISGDRYEYPKWRNHYNFVLNKALYLVYQK